MEHSIDYLEPEGIVHAKTSAALTLDAIKQLSQEALRVGRKHGVFRFLADYRDSELDLSILEIDDLPAILKDIGIGSEDKIAVLFNPESPKKSLFLFFQNVAFLRSLQFRVFPDEDKALAWLKSDPRKSGIQNTKSHLR
ncbi:MAG: STAS/SEC14 domain-containing protein [Sedimentisphaerales bacterium]|nr:STAS/SEC14 domain-containing protein [Sedimentisphaerales bacterium]